MVCSSMLPETAFEHVLAADVAFVATPTSDCQSPLDRWLGLPSKRSVQQSAPPSAFLVTANQAPAYPCAAQCQVPAAQVQQLQYPQVQATMQVTMQAPLQQQQQQQPTVVYFMPVPAPAPALPPAAPVWAVQQSATGTWMESCAMQDGAQSCSTDVSDRAASSSSDDDSLQETTQRLTASQARRRRRQRAAAFARAEKEQQPTSLCPGRVKVSLASALELTPDLCAGLAQQINAGGESTKAAIHSIRQSVRRLAFDSQGCRVMQVAIEKGSPADVAELLRELQGSVLRAASSPHGNYVLQKIVEVMPPAFSTFIVEELLGSAAETARHRFGCRIVCRLLEHSSTDSRTVKLMDELLAEVGSLVRHEFGHHVMESILEHGIEMHKQVIMVALEQEMGENVFNRSALFALDRALKQSTPGERRRLGSALRRAPETSAAMADPALSMHLSAVMAQAV
eukprot:TRINITY_DN1508_c2_g1_i1.p1 TRINITY_DN1508_c2_g1~~TRINITY_DN1508_c2_g1_i1.p1  ORF type:complete len:454 (+),score=102.35 TRINITY_DN1508_c2_g1_i1:83-1444(+)